MLTLAQLHELVPATASWHGAKVRVYWIFTHAKLWELVLGLWCDCVAALGVRQWTHHVRAHNKMADSLANLAMDTAASSQVLHPSARCGHADIHAHVSNDTRPWMASSLGRFVDFSFSSSS
jgi:hypothetical protein